MAKTNIPVQDLDFFEIKDKLKKFLKNQDKFQDYDFEGSSMNIHMDMLAYATHYMGFYAHMLHNESSTDSANLKPSLSSKAKFQNYVPGSKRSAQATVKFNVAIDAQNEPSDRKVVIPRGTPIKSSNNNSDNRTFILNDDLYIYNQSSGAGAFQYSSDETLIYEGSFEESSFIVDESILNQRFIIRDQNIDTNSLRIRVYDSEGDSNFVVYKQAQDYMTVNSESAVYFLSLNEEGNYEVHFGNGIYGRKVQNGNKVECTFVSTGGEIGNNARSFIFGGDFYYGGTRYDVSVQAISNSEGGLDGESIEDMRFNIPYHHRRQNRAVVADDYRTLLLSEYRNINSINVWGGEDNVPPVYGKTFISIKPKFGEVLSNKAKENILNKIIKRRNVTVIEAEIVDPDFLYIDLNVHVKYNPILTEKSSGQVKTDIQTAIDNYNDNYLNKFGGFYSDLDLNSFVRQSNPSILTSYTKIMLEKRFTPNFDVKQTYYIDFQNEIVAGTFKSAEFVYRMFRCYMVDDGAGKIRINYFNTGNNRFQPFPDEYFGEIDYKNGIVRVVDLETTGLYDKPKLSLYAKPENPDFFSKRNNIVTIDHVVLHIRETFENENEK